jgi:hypothetical protein
MEFFQTRMGAAFYEGTMPRIANSMEQLVKANEALLKQDEQPKAVIFMSNGHIQAIISDKPLKVVMRQCDNETTDDCKVQIDPEIISHYFKQE